MGKSITKVRLGYGIKERKELERSVNLRIVERIAVG